MFGSPVPTQMEWSAGSTATAPMDRLFCWAKTGFQCPAAVGGLPDTTGRRPGVQGTAVHRERCHPAPHQPRTAAGVGPGRVPVAQGVGVVGLVGDLLPAATRLRELARRGRRRGERGRADLGPWRGPDCGELLGGVHDLFALAAGAVSVDAVVHARGRQAAAQPALDVPPGEAETGTEPIMVIRVIAEPAAARCRPALHVRRMRLLEIAKARPREVTRSSYTRSRSSDRRVVTRSLSPGRARGAFGNGVGRTLRQPYRDWPDLLRCVTIRTRACRSCPQPPD